MEGTRGKSLAQRAGKAAVRQVLDTGIGNKKKLWIDLVKRACRVNTFVPGCNTVVGRPGWLSSHARLLVFFQAHK